MFVGFFFLSTYEKHWQHRVDDDRQRKQVGLSVREMASACFLDAGTGKDHASVP